MLAATAGHPFPFQVASKSSNVFCFGAIKQQAALPQRTPGPPSSHVVATLRRMQRWVNQARAKNCNTLAPHLLPVQDKSALLLQAREVPAPIPAKFICLQAKRHAVQSWLALHLESFGDACMAFHCCGRVHRMRRCSEAPGCNWARPLRSLDESDSSVCRLFDGSAQRTSFFECA